MRERTTEVRGPHNPNLVLEEALPLLDESDSRYHPVHATAL